MKTKLAELIQIKVLSCFPLGILHIQIEVLFPYLLALSYILDSNIIHQCLC
jgi:hypothetical protein